MFFIPANAVLNVTARFHVRLLPFCTGELPAPSILHWLFSSVPVCCRKIGPNHCVALSFNRYSIFSACRNMTSQVFGPPPVLSKTTNSCGMYPAPLASEATIAKVLVSPLPLAGVTEIFDGGCVDGAAFPVHVPI